MTRPEEQHKPRHGLCLFSWFIAAIFGVILCLGVIFTLTYVIDPVKIEVNDPVGYQRLYVGFILLMTIILTLLWLLLRPYTKKHFVKYFRDALLVGIVISFGLGILIISTTRAAYFADKPETCTTQRDQLSRAQASTYAIRTDQASGTGYAVKEDGTLITNAHVIEGAAKIYTWLTDENNNLVEHPLTVATVHKEFDIAVLKLDVPSPDFMPLTKTYKVAEDVYAVGFPGNTFSGGAASVTRGIVSRTVTNEHNKDLPAGVKLIQTDAAVNPGNSGGPLVGKCGVIGMNTAISTSDLTGSLPREEGISYAVSAETISNITGIPLQH